MKKWIPLFFFLMCAALGFADDCNAPAVPIPEPSEKALAFYKSGNILWMIENIWALAIPALVVFTGLGAKLRNLCNKITSIWLLGKGLYALFFFLILLMFNFPLAFYGEYIRPHTYGLSYLTLSRWLYQYLLGCGIFLVIGILIVWLVYGIICKSPRRWWLYLGLLNAPLIILVVIVKPIWIDPLFYKFGPMKDKVLEQKVLALARKGGIERSRVYEVEMSVDTKQVNAYVTGIGPTKRIVIWDTALQNLNEKELLFIVGHEMGHYVLHHMWWSILINTVTTLFTLFLVHITALFFIRKCGDQMGFGILKDIASLPLLVLLYTFYSFLFTPATNFFSRAFEHDADTYGLELTHFNHAAATGFVKLTKTNLANPWPGPFYIIFRSTHPSIGSRITYLNEYKPWCKE